MSSRSTPRNCSRRSPAAQRGGAATAMVGQGIGPIADRRLLGRRSAGPARRRPDRAARGPGRTPAPATARGFTRSRADDGRRRHRAGRRPRYAQMELGGAIGVNVRISDYSALTEAAAASVARAVDAAATQLGVPLQPIAISAVPGEEDAAGARPIVRCASRTTARSRCRRSTTSSPRSRVPRGGDRQLPRRGLRPVHGCAGDRSRRVAGTTRTSSSGLAEQFGNGCDVVCWLGGRGADDLAGIIVGAWERAPSLSSTLRAAGVRQVARGYEAYDRIAALVDARPDGPAPRRRPS